MNLFRRRLDELDSPTEDRRWLFIPYDQLSDQMGPLSREDPRHVGIVLVESLWKPDRRPYHRQKLALVLANLRHFALEQAARGVAVRHVATAGSFREALEPLIAELGPLRLMEPAERELRCDLAPLIAAGALEILPHEGWLSTREQFEASTGAPPWRMNAFYRRMRRDTGLLMKEGKPLGAKYSFDVENRQRWDGVPAAPEPPKWTPDEITREVGELIEKRFARHPGTLDLARLPASRGDANLLWSWAKEHCLEHFGPFEDAMSKRSSGLFHSRVSALLNLHRLLPGRLVAEVAELDAPLASREGFIRQVLGWREFMRHVHLSTDGFRRLPRRDGTVVEPPADEGGAHPSYLGADAPLPDAFWGTPSGLSCLDQVVEEVWREAYSHHITRLMVLANLATLLDVSPRQLTDWFWVAYADAYDWVVEPNVLGMGTFSAGDLMTSKPYVSGAAYIDRMSDYCGQCRFHPKKSCPVTPLYWAFLERHREKLAGNPRLALALRQVERRDAVRKRRDVEVFAAVRGALLEGREIESGHGSPAGDPNG